MKKILSIFISTLLALAVFSCTYVGKINMEINVVDEAENPISKEIFENLKFEVIREVSSGTYQNYSMSKSIPDSRNRNYRFFLSIKTGSGYPGKKIQSKYEDKLKGYAVKITDTSGFYEDIVLDPLPVKDYVVRHTSYGYPSWVEYTVKLKKKK